MKIVISQPRNIRSTLRAIALVGLACGVLPGCQSIDYRQVAYEALRQEDCRRNEVENFCSSSYSSEYHEYEQMRSEFLRKTKQTSGSGAIWDSSQRYSLGS